MAITSALAARNSQLQATHSYICLENTCYRFTEFFAIVTSNCLASINIMRDPKVDHCFLLTQLNSTANIVV